MNPRIFLFFVFLLGVTSSHASSIDGAWVEVVTSTGHLQVLTGSDTVEHFGMKIDARALTRIVEDRNKGMREEWGLVYESSTLPKFHRAMHEWWEQNKHKSRNGKNGKPATATGGGDAGNPAPSQRERGETEILHCEPMKQVPATPQIVVRLMDGSRLVGTTTLKEVVLKTTMAGELSLPLQRIASIKFSKECEFVTVNLANYDRIEKAVLGDTTLPLTTSFGQVMVPLDKATEILMWASGGVAVEWDLLPLPVDPSWEGDMGGPPMLIGDELVLRGWSARSKQTYRQPRVVECELWLDERRANEGCVFISFAPADLPREKLNRQSVLVVTVGYGARAVKVDGCGHTDERISRGDFTVAARETYRVRIELLNAKLRVTVDDQVYEANEVTLPDKDYQLYIRGWQPANTWRVRNTTVR